MNRPDTLAELVRRVKVDRREWHRALAGFLDTFYSEPDRRRSMIRDEPEFLGDPQSDAVLGAIGEHLARRWGLEIPAWTAHRGRFLTKPYFPTSLEGLKPLLIAQSPLAFRRRPIFVEHEPLARARMPRTAPKSNEARPKPA
ncbi:MAG: hypothetical protein ACREC6_01885 [Hyphomicrobiaceae bacterium]